MLEKQLQWVVVLCFLKNSFDNLASERVFIINPDIMKKVRRCHSVSTFL